MPVGKIVLVLEPSLSWLGKETYFTWSGEIKDFSVCILLFGICIGSIAYKTGLGVL